MAINFLNTIDLNKNQLNQAVIQNVAVDPGTAVVGQIIFNTTEDTLKQYVADTGGGSPGWESIGGDIQKVDGGTYITVTSPDGPIPIVNHDLTTRPADTNNGDASPGYGGTFTMIDSVTTNSTGHVTLANLKTITLPASDDTTYDLTSKASASSGADIDLTDSDGNVDTVTVIGTAAEIVVEQSATAGTIVISQPLDVTIGNDLQVDNDATVNGDLTVLGAGDFTGEVTVPTATTGTSATNLAQVELLVAGVGVFQGGYNALAGTVNNGGGSLSGASNIASDKGDYYVVTIGGSAFFGVALEVGDFIFAGTAIAANSSPSLGAYVTVIADANVAGAGATDGATEKGVSGFDSESFAVSSTGWVQLKPQANPYGAKQALNNTAPCTRAESGGLTTFTIDITDANIFGTSALASNVKAEITQIAAPYETVYADVARSGAGTISFAFTGSVASDVYAALLVYV